MTKPGTLIGPWKNLGPSYPDNIIGKSGQVLALVDKSHPAWKENAKAIQAVPELLAALESCLLRLDNHDEQSAPECLQARAALIKAGYTF